ncbi:hypothetical protein GCM10010151_51640 [Actinoallomurus spadix]|uniref:Uncharacterized protein n=1 Tax=Actinoallomurus spadix TaxID=79912 RepID=A0ABN0X5J1_9ACTN
MGPGKLLPAWRRDKQSKDGPSSLRTGRTVRGRPGSLRWDEQSKELSVSNGYEGAVPAAGRGPSNASPGLRA